MQTPGERKLVDKLADFLNEQPEHLNPAHVLNIGAGQSVSLEDQLLGRGLSFTEDRVDIDNPTIDHAVVRDTWSVSVEAMTPVPSGHYQGAFANYLLEHVDDLERASSEIYRVLKPGGRFMTTVPNPTAPEFLVSRFTPTRVHTWFRGEESWETFYRFRSVADLGRIFGRAGFEGLGVWQYPIVGNYTSRFPVLSQLGKLYDRGVSASGWGSLMGDACLVFEKPDRAAPIEV